MKQLFITAFIAVLATALPKLNQAQVNFFTKAADSMLQLIDKTPVTSGYLYDRAMPISNFAGFNNAVDTTNYEYAMQVYMELKQMAYSTTRMQPYETLDKIIKLKNLQKKIPIQILDYNYQQIKPTAVQEGLLQYNGGLLSNAVGNPNPYLNKHLQLATLMVENIDTPTVKLVLLPHLISRNTGANVTQVHIQGAGINVTLYGCVDSTTVTFPSNGKHYLTITTTLSNGTSFSTKNSVTIGDDNKTARTTKIVPEAPCRTESFGGSIPWQGYDEDRTFIGKFDVDYYYRQGVSCNGTEQIIKKPVILIDGFDATDKRNSKNQVLYSKFLRYIDDVNKPQKDSFEVDFVKQMRNLGNDVILVDIPTYFYEYNTGATIAADSSAQVPPVPYTLADGKIIHGGGDYVERNAMTLVAYIQYLHTKMGATDSIVIIGPSMGGQISRYALKWIEDRGLPHRVRLWISQDSPHEGAVVPIGLQMLIETLSPLAKKFKGIKNQVLLCPANKQFVVNHFDYNSTNNTENVGGAPNFFNRYYYVIDSIGWPQLCRKITTISGAENGMSLPIPSASELTLGLGARLGGINFGTSFWQNLLNLMVQVPCDLFSNSGCRLLDLGLYASPAPNTRGMVMRIKVPLFGLDLKKYVVASNSARYQSIETVQGGYFPGYNEISEEVQKITLTSSLVSSIVTLNQPARQHTFIPTASSSAYSKGNLPNVYGQQFKWDDDVTLFNLSCDKYIPFDYYMGPRTFSVLHDSIFYPQALVLISEIQGIKQENAKPIQLLFLSKNDPSKSYFCAGETLYFSANYYLWNATLTPTWVISDPTHFQIVSGQGTNTVGIKYLGGGTNSLNITITGEGTCYKYAYNQQIQMGVGDVWGGTLEFVSGSRPTVPPFNTTNIESAQFNFLPLVNGGNKYRVRIVAGLGVKENNLQQYSLLQNINGTAINWVVDPFIDHTYAQNRLHILSAPAAAYIFQVTDENRCGANQTNIFQINFRNNLLWRVAINPVKDELIIEKAQIDNEVAAIKEDVDFVNFSIYDIHTNLQLMQSKLQNTNKFNIPVKGLKNGEYAVKIGYGKNEETLKFWVRD